MGDCVTKEWKIEKTIHSFIVCVRDDEEVKPEDLPIILSDTKLNELIAEIAPSIKSNSKQIGYNAVLAISGTIESNDKNQLQQYNPDDYKPQFSNDESKKISSFIEDQTNTIYYKALVNNEAELKIKIDEIILESSLTQEAKDVLLAIPYSDLDDRSFSANIASQRKAGDQGVGFYLGMKQYVQENHLQNEGNGHKALGRIAPEECDPNGL